MVGFEWNVLGPVRIAAAKWMNCELRVHLDGHNLPVEAEAAKLAL
jgi:hypothetical protein